jgi:hypothetical protein
MSPLVNFGPLLEFLKPAIEQVAGTLALAAVTAGLSAIGTLYYRLLHVRLKTEQFDVLRNSAEAEVQKLVARGVDRLATMDVDLKSPIIAQIANAAISQVGPIAKKLGVTPDDMKQIALAAIGAYQSSVAAPAPSPPVFGTISSEIPPQPIVSSLSQKATT